MIPTLSSPQLDICLTTVDTCSYVAHVVHLIPSVTSSGYHLESGLALHGSLLHLYTHESIVVNNSRCSTVIATHEYSYRIFTAN